MSFKRVPNRKRDIQRARKRLRRNSPCGRPPAKVTGVTGSFDRAESARHNRIRAKVHWDEVTLDTSGFKIKLKHYIVQLQYTANGSDWFQARRKSVPAKTADEGSDDHTIFKNIVRNLGYRYRVRGVAQDGCKGVWSDWFVLGNPGTDEPPAPSNVRIIDNDVHMRCTLRWDGEPAADDDDLFDDKINHFVVEISKSQSFASIYRKNRGVKGNHVSFKIDEADENDIFFGRVRSVSSDKDKSAWIPATLNGNSDPGATPDGVSIGKALNKTKAPKVPTGLSLTFSQEDTRRGERWRAKCMWNEVVSDVSNNDIDIDHYVLNFQRSDNGSTWTNDPRRVMVGAKDEDADTTAFRVFHDINQSKFYRFRVRAISETNTRGAWSNWTAGFSPGTLSVPTPVNVTVRHRTRGKDRVVIDWEAPIDPNDSELPDERVAYFQVAMKKNSSVPPTTISGVSYRVDRKVLSTERTFTVPRADEDDTFYAWVRAVDDSGNKSAWVAGTRGGNSSSATAAELVQTDDNVPIGAIRKFAGNVVPRGYLRCNGQALSTSEFPELFAVIQYRYGGAGATFNVPDHRRRHARGAGSGQTEGENEGESNEANRNEDHGIHPKGKHGKHNKHKHKHHHRRRRNKVNDGAHADTTGGTPHDHNISINATGQPGATVSKSGTGSFAAGPNHTHSVSGSTASGGFHFHSLKAAHAADEDAQVVPAASSLFTDSLTGGTVPSNSDSVVDRNLSWDGGPTDSSGNPVSMAEDDDNTSNGHAQHDVPADDDQTNRGHRKHPFVRVHYNIKAE